MSDRPHKAVPENFPATAWAFARFAADRYVAGSMFRSAAALAYTSLLSLVPLLAIGLGMLAAFPAFAPLRARLRDLITTLVLPEIGADLEGWLTRFVDAAGQLTTAGVLGLALTAVLLLNTIVEALNEVFRSRKARPVGARIVLYWAALTLLPLLVGAGLSLSGALVAVGDWAGGQGLSGPVELVTAVMPTILTMLAFFLLYVAVPYQPERPVRALHALAGALLAGLLFAGLRHGFAVYVVRADTYRTVYGALAALPLFLTWLYLSWTVILAGATVTAALGEWRWRGTGAHALLGNAAAKDAPLAVAVAILRVLADAFRRGETVTPGRLAETVAADAVDLDSALARLATARFVVETAGADWVLGRDPATSRLADLVAAVHPELPVVTNGGGEAADTPLAHHMAAAAAAFTSALAIPLSDVLTAATTRRHPSGRG